MFQKIKTYVVAGSIAAGGFVAGQVPSLYKDLTFLRQARVQYEIQQAQQAARAAAPKPPPAAPATPEPPQ